MKVDSLFYLQPTCANRSKTLRSRTRRHSHHARRIARRPRSRSERLSRVMTGNFVLLTLSEMVLMHRPYNLTIHFLLADGALYERRQRCNYTYVAMRNVTPWPCSREGLRSVTPVKLLPSMPHCSTTVVPTFHKILANEHISACRIGRALVQLGRGPIFIKTVQRSNSGTHHFLVRLHISTFYHWRL